jgi:hypothetical protein
MGASGVPPDRGPSARSEIVHETEHTRVTRLFLPEHTIIRKEPLGPAADRRLRHELTMLEQLRGVPGVAQLLDAPQCAGSILLEDVGATSLTESAKPLAIDDLIGSATPLDRATATAVQVRSLTHRKRLAEAIELGVESLRECGVAVPAADRLPAELDRQFDHLHRWLDHT